MSLFRVQSSSWPELLGICLCDRRGWETAGAIRVAKPTTAARKELFIVSFVVVRAVVSISRHRLRSL